MKLVRFGLGLAGAVAVHVLGLRATGHFAVAVDLFLVLVVFHSLYSTPAWSTLGGSAAGLVQDALSGGLYGLHGFANTLIGYAACRLQQRLVIQQPLQIGLLFLLSAALQTAVLAILQTLMVRGGELPTLGAMAAKMVTTGLLGALLFALSSRLRQAMKLWRAGRRGRLTIERRGGFS